MMSNSVKIKLAAGLFVPAVALAGVAFAQSDKATTGQPAATTGTPPAAAGMVDKEALFKRLDTNNDGVLSAAEAQKDTKVAEKWKQLDASNKGSISKDDFLAGYDKK